MHTLKDSSLFRSRAFIDGQWLDADSGARFPVFNPASGEALGEVPHMGAAETRRAIAAANAAWPAWRSLLARDRSAVLQRWFQLILYHADDLARMMTLEQGKPLAEARGEVLYAASFVEWFAEEGKRVYGDTIPTNGADRRLMVIRQPVGVCAAITPWNFPAAMITRKVAPALAAGCTVVVKPAEQTPFTALALAELARQAGFPAGVFNVVTGDPVAIGGELTASPVVRKLSFTGSTEVGRLLMAQCAPTIKKLSLELGGNAPFIVFDDADLDAAVTGAMASKYRNTGQTCVCANRLLVQDSIYDAFAAKLAEAVQAFSVGNGLDSGVNLGPLIDEAAVDKVEAHVADALEKGARVLTGGKRHALGGNFFEPTVLADVTTDMRVAREETFGPVSPIIRFRDIDEAIAISNGTAYGLSSGICTNRMDYITRFINELQVGSVNVREVPGYRLELTPFGGIKDSGYGSEGGPEAVEAYLNVRAVAIANV